MSEKKKRFVFGKVDWRGTSGKKINEVGVEVSIRISDDDNHIESFSAWGFVYNMTHTDLIEGGQMLDKIAEYKEISGNPVFSEIYDLWKHYHLNDMHAGTPTQEEALEHVDLKNASRYDEACEYLDSIGLLEDEWQGRPYKYGHGWLNWGIPAEAADRMMALFNEPLNQGIISE